MGFYYPKCWTCLWVCKWTYDSFQNHFTTLKVTELEYLWLQCRLLRNGPYKPSDNFSWSYSVIFFTLMMMMMVIMIMMMLMVMAITMMTTTMVIMVLPAGGHRHLGDSEGLAQLLLPATTLWELLCVSEEGTKYKHVQLLFTWRRNQQKPTSQQFHDRRSRDFAWVWRFGFGFRVRTINRGASELRNPSNWPRRTNFWLELL